MAATFQKLKDGTWGLRVAGRASPGEVVLVTKRDGTSQRKTVGIVVWSGDGVTLCTIASGVSSSGGPRKSRDYPGKECPACESVDLDANLSCWECGYEGSR